MSIERKILADSPSVSTGHKAEPTGEQEAPGRLVVRGGEAYRVREPHVVDQGQKIFHLEEHTTSLRTLRYKENDGAIDPALASRWTLRANGDMSISLEKTPSVPAEQKTPDETVRTREADVEMVIYHAASVNVTWPVGVLWGRLGYELTGDPAALSELPGPPSNPRPAGTGDRFTLRYNERTGQWFASVTHVAVDMSDPSVEEPDATKPEPEDPENGDEGTGEETDHDYTDPETGDPLVPAAPAPGLGNVLALHSGSFSRTQDGGATWRLLSGVDFPYNFASLVGQGVMTATIDGRAVYTNDFSRFSEIQFPSVNLTEISVQNGDFETGDLTGWTLVSGTEPEVLDTVQPPQQAGAFYLSRDYNEIDGRFEIEQEIEVPQGAKIQVSADMYADDGEAVLEIVGEESLPVFGENLSWNNNVIEDYLTASDGSRLDLIVESGGMGGITSNSISSGKRIALRYKDGSLYEKTWPLAIRDLDSFEEIHFDIEDFGELVSQNTHATLSLTSTKAKFTTSVDDQDFVVTIKNGRISVYIGLTLSQIDFLTSPSMVSDLEAFDGTEQTVFSTAWDFPEWSRRTISTDTGNASDKVKIRLSGKFASEVYFDNVRAEIVEERDEAVRVVSRDLVSRRFMIGTVSSLHAWSKERGSEYLAPLPFAPLFLASHGDRVIVADQQQIAISTDAGLTFASAAKAGISQVFAHPTPLAVTDQGEVFSISTNATLTTVAPGTWAAWGAKRKQWYLTATGPAVLKAKAWGAVETHSSMPQSATAGNDSGDRKILALDSGRILAWVPNSRDMFHYTKNPDDTFSWKVSKPLTVPPQQMQELK